MKIEWKKIYAQRVAQKKVPAYQKKYPCKGNVNIKKFVQLENSPPPAPVTFLMVRPQELT